MHYATAIWNYLEPQVPLAELVREFAGLGYDTISFSSTQLGDPEAAELREAVEVIRQQHLGVTVHCSFDFGAEGVRRACELFGEALLAVTFDPVMESDTRGTWFATRRMAGVVAEALRVTEGSEVRVAIEDFPLDERALDCYRADLAPLTGNDRYGILIDVGHLNMRLRKWECFRGMTAGDYLAQVPLPIVEAHLHDNRGERDEHAHFGFGNTDFAAVAEGLKAVGFAGVSTIEIAPSFHDSTPAASKPHSRASLEEWRRLWGGR